MYFLASMYISFPEDAGGPGRALASDRHTWATVDPRMPGHLRTVVFLPCKGGVLELGSIAAIREDPEVLRAVHSTFRVEATASRDDYMRIFGQDVSRWRRRAPVLGGDLPRLPLDLRPGLPEPRGLLGALPRQPVDEG
jgi:hypothetical protein